MYISLVFVHVNNKELLHHYSRLVRTIPFRVRACVCECARCFDYWHIHHTRNSCSPSCVYFHWLFHHDKKTKQKTRRNKCELFCFCVVCAYNMLVSNERRQCTRDIVVALRNWGLCCMHCCCCCRSGIFVFWLEIVKWQIFSVCTRGERAKESQSIWHDWQSNVGVLDGEREHCLWRQQTNTK